MLFVGLGPNHNVIKIDMTDPPDMFLQRHHDTLLMSRRCVSALYRHDNPFPKAKGCKGSGVFNMVRVDKCLEEGIRHVNFPPDFSLGTVSEDIVDSRKWEGIRYSDFVQATIVNNPTWQDRRVGFGDNEGRG